MHIINGEKIRTNGNWHGPYKWSATSDNYDASYEEGRWIASHPIGYGQTEEEAIRDYLEQVEEDA